MNGMITPRHGRTPQQFNRPTVKFNTRKYRATAGQTYTRGEFTIFEQAAAKIGLQPGDRVHLLLTEDSVRIIRDPEGFWKPVQRNEWSYFIAGHALALGLKRGFYEWDGESFKFAKVL